MMVDMNAMEVTLDREGAIVTSRQQQEQQKHQNKRRRIQGSRAQPVVVQQPIPKPIVFVDDGDGEGEGEGKHARATLPVSPVLQGREQQPSLHGPICMPPPALPPCATGSDVLSCLLDGSGGRVAAVSRSPTLHTREVIDLFSAHSSDTRLSHLPHTFSELRAAAKGPASTAH